MRFVMARTTAHPRTEAEVKARKKLLARQRREKLKQATMAAVTGRNKCSGCGKAKPASKNGKSATLKGGAAKQQQKKIQIVRIIKGKAVTHAAKKSKVVSAVAAKKNKAAAAAVAKKSKAVAAAAKKNKVAAAAVAKKSKTAAVAAAKKNKAAAVIAAKKSKAAVAAAKKSKAAAVTAAKKSKAAVTAAKKSKAAAVVAKKGKVTATAARGSKKSRAQAVPARKTAGTGRGQQQARTGAQTTKTSKPTTPAPTVGKKRTAQGPASRTVQPPPAKLARVDSINTQLRKAISAATSSPSTSQAKKTAASKTYKIDDVLKTGVSPSAKVYKDYSCMLNQTNIGFNNNKYYVIQVVEDGKTYIFFTRWGRVGESGQNKLERFTDSAKAVKAFEKKFWDKTYNGWGSRNNFTPKTKKYTLLEMDEEDDDDDEPASSAPKIVTSPSAQSSLDERTQRLARIIFSDTMFTQQMADMNLDVKKMPLGKLSKSQIAKGLEALLDIEEAIKKGDRSSFNQLTSKFYTLIPHNFGRSVPPVIGDLAVVQNKKDMLITLADIELTQSLQKTKGAPATTQNPLDAKMSSLGCTLTFVNKTSPEFKWIRDYASACPNTRKHTLLDVWRVDRMGEHTRFSKNDSIKHRKLLWHGTKVAVVAAILNSGLRIMPHSGGRVGRGIYFASEHAKSSWYVGIHFGAFEGEKNVGFMFLVEVALGRTHDITSSSGSQKAAPPGFDSIVARGQTEPDSEDEMEIDCDGKKVIVPKGKPKKISTYSGSHFGQSEYLVYREDQARIRYLLKFSFA